MSSSCAVFSLGRVDYDRALDLQRSLVRRRADGDVGDLLLLLDHPHVYTLGRRGKQSDVLLSPEALEALGIPVRRADRGGEVTYHGPGQLVGYPIVDLRRWGGARRYVSALEAALVDALDALGVSACVRAGMPGVWVSGSESGGDRKIAAIGVRITRGVTSHGFALNLDPDLAHFDGIVPCGIEGLEVTSVARELGGRVDPAAAEEAVVRALGLRLGLAMHRAKPPYGSSRIMKRIAARRFCWSRTWMRIAAN